MKITFRIILILLVATVVSGAFFLAINNSSTASISNDGGQAPAVISNNSQSTTQPMVRPEGGDRDGGSITGGLSGVLVTLGKLTAVTLTVLLIQKAFSLLGNRELIRTQR
jgi:hypothetical protein